VEARNKLENYVYHVRQTLDEEKIKEKLSADDLNKLQTEVQQTLDWLDRNPDASVDDYKNKQSDLEKAVNPTISKIYGAEGSGESSDTADRSAAGPKVEEVD
jgi:hypothetical protein